MHEMYLLKRAYICVCFFSVCVCMYKFEFCLFKCNHVFYMPIIIVDKIIRMVAFPLLKGAAQ